MHPPHYRPRQPSTLSSLCCTVGHGSKSLSPLLPHRVSLLPLLSTLPATPLCSQLSPSSIALRPAHSGSPCAPPPLSLSEPPCLLPARPSHPAPPCPPQHTRSPAPRPAPSTRSSMPARAAPRQQAASSVPAHAPTQGGVPMQQQPRQPGLMGQMAATAGGVAIVSCVAEGRAWGKEQEGNQNRAVKGISRKRRGERKHAQVTHTLEPSPPLHLSSPT